MSAPAEHPAPERAPPRSEPWRLILGLLLIAAIYMALIFGWFVAGAALGAGFGNAGTTPASAFFILLSFACVFPGLAVALRVLHRDRLTDLLRPVARALRDGGRTGAAALIVFGGALLLPSGPALEPQPNLAPGLWILWLVPGLLALAVQVSAEELVFRGYIQRQLAARFASPLIWMALPALCFALLHYDPTSAGDNAVWLLLPPFLFGLVAADLTARSGTLGPAIALHLVNNVGAVLLVAPGGVLSGLALYRLQIAPSNPAFLTQLPVEVGLLLVVWLAARLALRR